LQRKRRLEENAAAQLQNTTLADEMVKALRVGDLNHYKKLRALRKP